MRVYIAGPINTSGLFIENLRNALQAATMVREAGHYPFVPNLYLTWQAHTPLSEEDMLRMDKEWLLQCHAMVRLTGKSRGADLEEQWAREANIPVFKQEDENIGDRFNGVRLFIAAAKAGRVRTDHVHAPTPMPWTGYGPHREHDGEAEVRENLRKTVYPSLSYFQDDVSKWLRRQPFGQQQSWEPLVGMMEELGELSHAHLKHHQKIRGMSSERAQDAKEDALGDILVYAAGYAIANSIDLGRALERAWSEVRQRDWSKNTQDGKPVTPPPPPAACGTPMYVGGRLAGHCPLAPGHEGKCGG